MEQSDRDGQPAGVLIIGDVHMPAIVEVAQSLMPGTSVRTARDAASAMSERYDPEPALIVAASSALGPDVTEALKLIARWLPMAALVVAEDASRPVNQQGALRCGAQEVIGLSALTDPGARAYVQEAMRRSVWRQEYVRRLKAESHTDELTGVLNRRGWMRAAEAALHASVRATTPLLVMMWDVDNLKTINDTLGHAVGDQALRNVAEALQVGMRASDAIGRWGGDEFVALAPGATQAEAESIHARIATRLATLSRRDRVRVTVSYGSACRVAGSSMSIADLLDAADRSLGASKARKGAAPGTE